MHVPAPAKNDRLIQKKSQMERKQKFHADARDKFDRYLALDIEELADD